MTTWPSDELSKIGKAEELELASRSRDGTLRKPVTLWIVRVGDDLFVRSVNGRTGVWFRAALEHHQGRVWADGVEKDVTFVEVGDESALNDRIDNAYRDKYRRYAATIVGSVLTPKARSATLKLIPRATGA